MLLSLLLILIPTEVSFDFQNQIVIWNVGQGQWITALTPSYCVHFDSGGEFFNKKKVSQICSQKKNYFYFSHWDWDHINFANKLKKLTKSACIVKEPNGKAESYKHKFLNRIEICSREQVSSVEPILFSYQRAKKDNDFSRVFIYANKILIPGDSTHRMEKIWSPQIKSRKLKWLFLAHHGSKTSTSKAFLGNNADFEFAIVSARKKVYGHPHWTVQKRLKEHHIPLLKTEDWGNIRILTF
jgi:competence protein ComEC